LPMVLQVVDTSFQVEHWYSLLIYLELSKTLRKDVNSNSRIDIHGYIFTLELFGEGSI